MNEGPNPERKEIQRQAASFESPLCLLKGCPLGPVTTHHHQVHPRVRASGKLMSEKGLGESRSGRGLRRCHSGAGALHTQPWDTDSPSLALRAAYQLVTGLKAECN